MKEISKFLCGLICFTTLLGASHDNGEIEQLRALSKGFASVAKKATPAVVSIKVEASVPEQVNFGPMGPSGSDPFHQEFFRRFFGMPPGEQQPQTRMGHGSGFLVTDDGYILTNNHIVGNASSIEVRTHDGRRYEAELVGADPQTDVAVIKIEGEDFPHIELADSDDAEVGDWAIAIGSPFGLEASVTVGIVSAKGRDELHITDLEDFIQTDAAINPGNSGGPLLDLDAKAIGVNTAIVTGSGGYMGIGFAIPSNMARRIMEQLMKDGSVTRGFLGVTLQPVDSDIASAFGLDKPTGALVTEVLPDSPAADAGIEQGDIVIEFNGNRIESVSSLRNAVSMLEPNQKVNLKINREGKVRRKTVVIGTHPHAGGQPGSVAHKLGLEVDALDDNLASQLNYQNLQGVVVKRVEVGSVAAKVNIKPGALIVRVNRTPVSTPEEFYAALNEAAASSDRVLLLVRQGQVTRFVSLKL